MEKDEEGIEARGLDASSASGEGRSMSSREYFTVWAWRGWSTKWRW